MNTLIFEGSLSPEVKGDKREANDLPSSGVDVKNPLELCLEFPVSSHGMALERKEKSILAFNIPEL
jgi:hypothetical protein